MKNHIRSVLTLIVICAVISVLMALTNTVTKPIIEANAAAAASGALSEVLPGGTGFQKIENFNTEYNGIPSSVVEIQKAANGGYAITLSVNGYGAGMKVMIGVDASGTIVGAKCLDKGGETKGEEATYGDKTVGSTLATIDSVDTVAGTTKTTEAYKGAAKAALQTAAILGGASIDTRTPEEILQDNLKEALPSAESFNKVFLAEVLDGVSAVYEASNNVGKVYVVGESFIAVDANGTVLNGTEEEKNVVKTADAKLAASTLEAIDLSSHFDNAPFHSTRKGVYEAYKTASGNYVMLVRGAGFGIMNDDEYIHSSGEYIEIKLSMTADGTIIDCLTIYQSESPEFGGVCAGLAYYGQYAGKTESTLGEVDAIAGATYTSDGYMGAVKLAFKALEILKGGD